MVFDEKQLYSDLVDEICGRDCPKYDKLVIFVHNLLSKKVKSWCYSDSVLRGGMHDEDVMQEIQIRIMKKCEDHFFKPVCGITDKTCEEFKAWCFKVAKNYFLTYCVKQKNRKEVELNLSIKLDDDEVEPFSSEDSFGEKEKSDENKSRLKECFAIVFELKSSLHIVLTWLSVSLVMMVCDTSKIESTHFLVEKFSDITLCEMFDLVVRLLLKLDWLMFDEEQLNKQKKKLDTINKDTGKRIGDMKYSEFYMSKGPEMSVSDWINRVNAQIKKQLKAD